MGFNEWLWKVEVFFQSYCKEKEMLREQSHWCNSEKEKSWDLTADVTIHKVNTVNFLIWRRNVWVVWMTSELLSAKILRVAWADISWFAVTLKERKKWPMSWNKACSLWCAKKEKGNTLGKENTVCQHQPKLQKSYCTYWVIGVQAEGTAMDHQEEAAKGCRRWRESFFIIRSTMKAQNGQ